MTRHNGTTSVPPTVTFNAAVEKLMAAVERNGHDIGKVNKITLHRRFNGDSGVHVHATCSVTTRFDESVKAENAETERELAAVKY